MNTLANKIARKESAITFTGFTDLLDKATIRGIAVEWVAIKHFLIGIALMGTCMANG